MTDDLKQSGSTTTSQPTTTLEQVKTGRVLDFTWAPNANTTTTVVSADFIDYEVDTSQGSPTGDSHSIARFTYAQGKGGGQISQLFLEEMRAGVRASTQIGLMVGRKWALDADADVSGSIGTYVIDLMTCAPVSITSGLSAASLQTPGWSVTTLGGTCTPMSRSPPAGP